MAALKSGGMGWGRGSPGDVTSVQPCVREEAAVVAHSLRGHSASWRGRHGGRKVRQLSPLLPQSGSREVNVGSLLTSLYSLRDPSPWNGDTFIVDGFYYLFVVGFLTPMNSSRKPLTDMPDAVSLVFPDLSR